jgi:hypothetical protein
MPTMSNGPKGPNDPPGGSPASSSTGEKPPPKKSATLPKADREGEQHQQALQKRQSAMAADVEKKKGNTQSQQPAKDKTEKGPEKGPDKDR